MNTTVEAKLAQILQGAVSPITLESVLARLGAVARRRPEELGEREREAMLGVLRVSLRLFARGGEGDLIALCEKALRGGAVDKVPTLGGAPTPEIGGLRRIEIANEADITTARFEAWAEAARIGVPKFSAVKVATAVSELARNIFFYAGSGVVEIQPRRERGKVSLRVVARDNGPGIAPEKLRAIEAGTYRSERGMGRGLMAVKKLVDSFDLDTAPGRGTTVSCEFRVVA
jgi:serine/threonine-protein kinase RsbT